MTFAATFGVGFKPYGNLILIYSLGGATLPAR